MPNETASSTDWTAVLARAQAFLALQSAGLDEASMVERAKFLMMLGLPRAEAAALLGTSDDSLRVQFARAAKKTAKAPTKDAAAT